MDGRKDIRTDKPLNRRRRSLEEVHWWTEKGYINRMDGMPRGTKDWIREDLLFFQNVLLLLSIAKGKKDKIMRGKIMFASKSLPFLSLISTVSPDMTYLVLVTVLHMAATQQCAR